jgi:Ice-binding-like
MNRFESVTKPMIWSTTLLLAAIVAGCGGGSGSPNAPGTGLGPTGGDCTGTGCVNLGKAANYVILAKTGVSTVPNSVVTGNVGLSPAARSFLTGWSLLTEPTDTSFGSAQVTGRLFAADNVGGTTSVDLTTAVGDMQTAYTTANGGAAGAACPGTGNFGGQTITPGVYDCAVNVGIATSTTLSGAGVYVFRITGSLTQAAATQVTLSGGAVAQNVFWVVSGTVAVGTTATMNGVILGKTSIAMGANSTENGRLLAQTAVTLNQTTVTQP